MPDKPSIAIVGGGPAALMLACALDSSRYRIALYERNAALGRKFLVAGKGGFNLTHSEEPGQFADRYTPAGFMAPFLQAFSNTDLRVWLSGLGIDTYVGSSKRVFPVKGVKPIAVLKAIEERLIRNGVQLHLLHDWRGWQGKGLVFGHREQEVLVEADIVVFALGGASWRVTGSDGHWAAYFQEKGIEVQDFLPSNCAYRIGWDRAFAEAYAGQALKNTCFSCGDRQRLGEAVITESGIEGSGIYPLSPAIRRQLQDSGEASLLLDLKPDLGLAEIIRRLEGKGRLSMKEALQKKLSLSALQIALLRSRTAKETYQQPERLAASIKALPLRISGTAPLDEAISTVGGVPVEALSPQLGLRAMPGHYCIGEMIGWDAPTGGYLLQACFSMGYSLAQQLNNLP